MPAAQQMFFDDLTGQPLPPDLVRKGRKLELEYFEENALLGASENPEETYIQEVMPAKLALNTKYIEDMGLGTDLKILLRTAVRIVGRR